MEIFLAQCTATTVATAVYRKFMRCTLNYMLQLVTWSVIIKGTLVVYMSFFRCLIIITQKGQSNILHINDMFLKTLEDEIVADAQCQRYLYFKYIHAVKL